MRLISRLPLHPFLFAALAVLSPLETNIEGISPNTALRPLLFVLATTLLLLIFLVLKFRSVERPALAATVFVIFFSSYGHMAHLMTPGQSNPGLAVHLALGGAWLALALLGVRLIIKGSVPLHNASTIANLLAFAVIAIPINGIIRNNVEERKPLSESLQAFVSMEAPGTDGPSSAYRPNIIYIVLDGYAGEEILREIYGLDNTEFISYLRREGFYVADRSRSNYSQTHLSLASSLNMNYLTVLAKELGPGSTDDMPVTRILRTNAVRRLLEEQGYTLVTFATGYRRTEISDTATFAAPAQVAISPFESMLIENSFMLPFQYIPTVFGAQPYLPGYEYHRNLIEFGFDQLKSLPQSSEPLFVFAHIIAPHPPFAFDREGKPTSQGFPFRITDGNQYPGTPQEYIEGYREQLLFVNQELMDIVGLLKSQTAEPPVIILQADHGPGAYLNWDSPHNSNHQERMSILNAIFLPEPFSSDQFYPDISPVNTFRVVLNSILGFRFELLPDEACFSSWRQPYDFIPIPVNGEEAHAHTLCRP